MTAVRPVAHGTAEQLARLVHFRALTDALPEAHELDPVIRFLVGPVGVDAHQIIGPLSDDLDQLWSLLTEDYDDDQLDELTDDTLRRYEYTCHQEELELRHGQTISRLVYTIEAAIYLARLIHAEHGRGVAA